jgi:hypothetical protein
VVSFKRAAASGQLSLPNVFRADWGWTRECSCRIVSCAFCWTDGSFLWCVQRA